MNNCCYTQYVTATGVVNTYLASCNTPARAEREREAIFITRLVDARRTV